MSDHQPVTDDIVWCSDCGDYHLPGQHINPILKEAKENLVVAEAQFIASMGAWRNPSFSDEP